MADGRGNTQFNDDVSYRLQAVSAGADLTLIESLSLHLGYIYRRKDFTSELPGDTHFNRHDDIHQGIAEFGYRLTSAASLSASFQRTQGSSSVVTRTSLLRSIPSGAAIVFESFPVLSDCILSGECLEREKHRPGAGERCA